MDARVNIKGEYTPKEEFVKFFREYAWHIFFFFFRFHPILISTVSVGINERSCIIFARVRWVKIWLFTFN